jgi:hypothetical protein
MYQVSCLEGGIRDLNPLGFSGLASSVCSDLMEYPYIAPVYLLVPVKFSV